MTKQQFAFNLLRYVGIFFVLYGGVTATAVCISAYLDMEPFPWTTLIPLSIGIACYVVSHYIRNAR